MHQVIGSETFHAPGCAAASVDGITLHRDPQTDEWVFDLTPGIDLLEVLHVLAAVQQHALQLLQKQMHALPAAAASQVNPQSEIMPLSAPLPTLNQYVPF